MDEDHEETSIASCGRSCSKLFTSLAEGLEASCLGKILPASKVKEESKRFEVWARNIAALQDARLPSSLEYRLHEDTNACRIVRKALLYLKESLDMALLINLGTKSNQIWREETEIEETTDASTREESRGLDAIQNFNASEASELKELGLAIRDGVSNLFELSMVIRKKPKTDEYVKAALEFPIDPTADVIHIGDKYPSSRMSEIWLVNRLGTAITRRRQYLLYRREHQRKMEEIHTLKTGVDGKTVWSGEKASTYFPNETFATYSAPVHTSYVGPPQTARTEYADSSRGKDGANNSLRTPLLPRKSDGKRVEYNEHFECPYCWRPQNVSDKNAWKKHIFSDLRPYICTFEGCDFPMFESQHQWFDHELRFHRKQWRCPYCEESHQVSRANLENHLREVHADLPQELGLNSLTKSCQIMRMNATECPLCTSYGQRLQEINSSSKCDVSLIQFQQHLGRHMEQLALAALPHDDADKDELSPSEASDSNGVGAPIYDNAFAEQFGRTSSESEQQSEQPLPPSPSSLNITPSRARRQLAARLALHSKQNSELNTEDGDDVKETERRQNLNPFANEDDDSDSEDSDGNFEIGTLEYDMEAAGKQPQ